MEKGLKYKPNKGGAGGKYPESGNDPELDIDCSSGGCPGCSYPDDEIGWKPKGGGIAGKDPEIDIAKDPETPPLSSGPVRIPGSPEGRPQVDPVPDPCPSLPGGK